MKRSRASRGYLALLSCIVGHSCYNTYMTTATLLDKIFEPFAEVMTPEIAARFVAMRADDEVQRRMDELADKCTEGQLTDEERQEYDTYLRAIDFISIMQSKTRQVLQRRDNRVRNGDG